MFTFKNINNGTLRSTKSMPQKDITSDNQSTFSMGRRKYVRTLGVDTTLINNNMPDTIRKNIQKKWYGSSSTSDSSRVLNKRVNNEIGNGSLNSSRTSMSFTSDSAIVPAIFNLNAIDGSGSATLTFNIDSGGSLITNYQYAIDGINSGIFKSLGPSINNPYLLPDSLIPGTSYKVYLKAFNKLGEGASDTSVIPSTLPRLAPSVPTGASLDYTNSIITYDASVSFTTRTAYFTPIPPSAGSGIGWSPIVSYKLLLKDSTGSNTLSTYLIPSGSTQIISGLKVVTDYKLSLSAFNKHGEGPYSIDSAAINILAVPPYNIDLSANILVDASDTNFYNRVSFTNPNVPTIDISFAINAAPTNIGGNAIANAIVGYNYNCIDLCSNNVFTYPQRNVIKLNANTLNTINIYARNNIGIAPIPKQITYFPIIPPPKPIILSASVTGTSGAYLNVTFTGSNDYPSDSDISGYQSALRFAVGPDTTFIWTNITNSNVMSTSLTQPLTNNTYRFYPYNISLDGLVYCMIIRPISKNGYVYPAVSFGNENTSFHSRSKSFMFGNPPYINSVKFIYGDQKVVLYDFSLAPVSVINLNDYVVYSYSLDNRNWSTTDLFVNANLPDNNNSYNLYVRAHNIVGISNTYTISVRGLSTPPTPVMAVYQYLTGVLLVATPGQYVSKYLDEVMYNYDKYSVTYSYSFDNSVYTNFPVYSTPTNRRQVFIKKMPSGTKFDGSILTTDASLSLISGKNYTLYLRSTSINSNVSSVIDASTNFTFTPVDISGIGKTNDGNNYKTFKIGDLRYIIWPNSGTITFTNAGTIEILIIGGGGAGGNQPGAGGGAGEVLNGFINVISGANYNVNVPGTSNTGQVIGVFGTNVDFSGVTAYGGGGGMGGNWGSNISISNASSGGGSYYSGQNTLRGQIASTRPYVVSNNNTYIFSYGGNLGSNAIVNYNRSLIMNGGGGGSGTPGRYSVNDNAKNPGGGTNKVSDWILDISGQMDSIQAPNKYWSAATINNGIGYIASGGKGVFNGLNDTIVNYNELSTSQVFGYGGGGEPNSSATYNTGSGSGGYVSNINVYNTSGIVVIRYYE
jgi:hypothetical protein